MISIIDYGMGNLGSICNMLRRVGAACEIVNDPAQVRTARKLLLPGVGAFDQAMERIESRGLKEVLDQKVLEERVPILGICLGMQLLTRSSAEGTRKGFGWIGADTLKFPALPGLKVPHMGWNRVAATQPSPLTHGLSEEARFYFVHSYFVQADDPQDVVLQAEYGVRFAAAIARDNIFGAQFHPEKSHRFGMQLFANFAGVAC